MPSKKETFLELEKATGVKRRRLLAQILEENKPIALILVRRFRQQWDLHNLPVEDFEQAAFIGVLRAAESYKWGAGSTFSSWLTDHVRQELQNLAHSMGHNVKRWVVPAAKIREMRAFETRTGRAPTAEEAGVTDKQLTRINEPLPQFLTYDESDEPETPTVHFGERDLTEIRLTFDELDAQEQYIISRLFDGASESEIAEDLHKTRGEVHESILKIRCRLA